MVIDCNIYDYVELACLYQLAVVATLKDNSRVSGIATTIIIEAKEHDKAAQGSKREECIVLKADNGDALNVVLTQIVSLTCVNENPHFKTLNFSNGSMTK